MLCAAGLLVPFTARLWNIGIEGQVVLGAIFCTGAGAFDSAARRTSPWPWGPGCSEGRCGPCWRAC